MKKLYRLLNKLRRLNPPCPVKIKIVKPKEAHKLWGDCNFDGSEFTIRIVRGHIDIMCLILVHEFSHCFTWDEERIHGPEWGVAFARCWEIYAGDVIACPAPVVSPST